MITTVRIAESCPGSPLQQSSASTRAIFAAPDPRGRRPTGPQPVWVPIGSFQGRSREDVRSRAGSFASSALATRTSVGMRCCSINSLVRHADSAPSARTSTISAATLISRPTIQPAKPQPPSTGAQ